MKKNNKGFTLVELLAVTIILIFVFLIAINAIGERTKKSKMDSVKASALSYFKAARALSETTTGENNPFYSNNYSVNQLKNLGLEVSGTKPKSGFIYFDNNEPICGCLKYGKYKIEYINGNYSDVTKGICSDDKMQCAQYATTPVFEFEYTGNMKKFTVPADATYKLEVWGAQGGSSKSQEVAHGGYGGYSAGTIHLNKDDKLYVTVGGKGVDGDNTSTTKTGGFNGGGNKVTPDSAYYGSSGGGATHIATKTGVLSSLSSSTSNIIIVAGGGGGGAGTGDNYGAGGSGGGYVGMRGGNSYGNVGWGNGGTQTQAGCKNTSSSYCGSFGQGNGTSNGHGGAGGGGFYGGGATNSDNIGGGGGGSGYIQTSILTNASMYCYNCQESGETATKTISTECVEETPTRNCAKKGNGYARITMYRTIESDDDYDD